MTDKLIASHAQDAGLIMRPTLGDMLAIAGRFHVEHLSAEGRLLWEDDFDNTVVTVGKNLILDEALAGSSWTMTGPYMGLISSVSYSAISASDTMSSHAGWTEAGGTNAPTFSARIACAWSAASGGSKSLSAALSFTMTGGGTLEGAFLVGGSGAVSTIGNTSGTLISAGLFASGARAVLTGDVVNVSYSMSI